MIALLGMVAAHLVVPVPGRGPGGVDSLFQVVAGRSSALFAVLAGVSLALITRTPAPGDRRRLLVRAALVALIGLTLGGLPSGVAVILVNYGLLFCCAAPVLRWRAASLGALAVGWGLLSPVVSLLLRRELPPATGAVPSAAGLVDPGTLVSELLVTGYYPVLTWATYLFAGLAVGRLLQPALGVAPAGRAGAAGSGPLSTGADHRVPLRVVRGLLVGGAWLAALALATSATITRSAGPRAALLHDAAGGSAATGSWAGLERELRSGLHGTHPPGSAWWLGVWSPHSGSIVDLSHTTGTALLTVGLCLWAVRLLPRLPWRLLGGAGAMTLTLYTLHVVALAVTPAGSPLSPGHDLALPLHAALAVGMGAALAAAGRPGPLEHLVGVAAQAAAPASPTRGSQGPRV